MKLISDFTDPYDHWLPSRHSDPRPWDRRTETDRPRVEDHEILSASGLIVPVNGSLSWVRDHFGDGIVVVAYVNPTLHRGSGKLRDRVDELMSMGIPGDTYCSEWIEPPADCHVMSMRLMLVGDIRVGYELNQTQAGEWRSNVGECYSLDMLESNLTAFVDEFAAIRSIQERLKAPLVAVDFVPDEHRDWLAIDLATAPGLSGVVGIPEWEDVAKAISDRFDELHGEK